MTKSEKGSLGENAVCVLLRSKGHIILERNYRRTFGEIDIISKKDEFIVFTEVKTRHINSMVSGVEAVDWRKKGKIIKTADCYLSEHDFSLQPRYDIAEVVISYGDTPSVIKIELYEDAFTTDGFYTIN